MIYNVRLRNRAEPKIENIIRKNQNGFRSNRSTTSQILSICQILEGVRAKKKKKKNTGNNIIRRLLQSLWLHTPR